MATMGKELGGGRKEKNTQDIEIYIWTSVYQYQKSKIFNNLQRGTLQIYYKPLRNTPNTNIIKNILLA